MHRVLTIIFFVAWICGGCNNAVDEGTSVSNPNQHIDSLILQAFDLQYNDPQACDSFAQIILIKSEKEANKTGIANAWFLKSSAQQQFGNYDSAIALAKISLAHFTEMNDKQGMARCYNDLGIDYDFKAYYAKAIDNYLKALKIFDELKDEKGLSNAYNNIGLIHQNQSNHNEASRNYQKALSIAQKIGYENGVLNTLNNMGSNFLDIKNYDSALSCFQKVLSADLASGNKSYIAYSYNNVGQALLGLGNYNEALAYLQKSKTLKEELNNRRALANTLLVIGETYLRLKDFEAAQTNLLNAIAIASELSVPEIEKGAYNTLHELNVQKGNYKIALDYFKKYEQIKDAISYDKKEAQINLLEKEYEVEKAQLQLAQTQNIGRINRLLALVYGSVALLLLILLSTLWVVYGQKRKTNKALVAYQQTLEKSNRELEEKNTQILAQKKEIELALSARSRFLSFMSHEIRTPLNGITGLVDLLQAMPILDEQTEYMEALKRSSDNLLLLLNNVLDLSRLEVGKINLEEGMVNVRKLLQEQEMLFKANALSRKNDIIISIDENVPERVTGDPYRLAQILSNLLNNAIKFTKEGTITLHCEAVYSDEQNTALLFSIKDTGIGIPKNQLKAILEPFVQAESYTTRKYGGSGLGLTIVGLLLKAMNSELKVDSEVGQGSNFYFKLVMPNYQTPLVEGKLANIDAGKDTLEGLKVLVVEDNTTNILLFGKILSGWKTEYDVADNGFKAIEFASEKQYDIILMDLHLPKISGYETAQRIKTTVALNKKTPILAITAAHHSEVDNHPQRPFLDGVMYKPLNPSLLLKSIKQLL